MATLFEECIEALEGQAKVLPIEETEGLFDNLEKKFPMLISGHIDWRKVKNKIQVEAIEDILQFLKDKDHTIFVFWDHADIPGLKSDLTSILKVIDDVTAVGFYTWLFSPNSGYVIEFGHAYATLGFCNKT